MFHLQKKNNCFEARKKLEGLIENESQRPSIYFREVTKNFITVVNVRS